MVLLDPPHEEAIEEELVIRCRVWLELDPNFII
jgi:hypothetical protein